MKVLKVIVMGTLLGALVTIGIFLVAGWVILAIQIPEWLHLPDWISALTGIMSLTIPIGIVMYLGGFDD